MSLSQDQNYVSDLGQMERDFNHLRRGGKSLCRETGDGPQAQGNCSLTSSAENCCATHVCVYLKTKRTSLGHVVNGKANIGGSN